MRNFGLIYTVQNSFRKYDRLASKKTIEELFSEGEHFFIAPFKVLYLSDDELPFPLQVAISVPKKKMRKAVERNYVKRLFREVWRTEKHRLTDRLITDNRKMAVFIIYTGLYEKASLPSFREKIIVILERLVSAPLDATKKSKNEDQES